MIRYIWNGEGKHIYKDASFNEKIPINVSTRNEKIYVNILERKVDDCFTLYKVKLYFSNGEVLEGWTSDSIMFDSIMFIEIKDTKDELFDGRFNQ